MVMYRRRFTPPTHPETTSAKPAPIPAKPPGSSTAPSSPQLDDDVDLSLTSLAKDLGISYSKLLGFLRAHFRMRQLPLVTHVQGHPWILDLTKLRIIDRELTRLEDNPDHLDAIDAALADFLTPTTPNQTVPTVGLPASCGHVVKLLRG
jgi:HNH endonuclease domain protein